MENVKSESDNLRQVDTDSAADGMTVLEEPDKIARKESVDDKKSILQEVPNAKLDKQAHATVAQSSDHHAGDAQGGRHRFSQNNRIDIIYDFTVLKLTQSKIAQKQRLNYSSVKTFIQNYSNNG